MARQRRRDPHKERHWRQLVEQWQRSGQSVRAFCAAHGLSEQSLYWWRRELAARDHQAAPAAEAAPPPPCFVPVHVRAEPVEPLANGLIEVVLCNGRLLRAAGDVDPRRLAELAAALEARAC
jgi:transposase-like protein